MEACRMSDKIAISLSGIKPSKIAVAKNNEIWLNFDQFNPESSIPGMHLLSDVPEILEMQQTKVESAFLALSEKPF
jgi:hypothetical protein